jgi:tartrate dehydratase alpha subunit/fumarate hydratase class I-like protein
MVGIREAGFVDSIAEALQFISCHHPRDFVRSLAAAYEREESGDEWFNNTGLPNTTELLILVPRH